MRTPETPGTRPVRWTIGSISILRRRFPWLAVHLAAAGYDMFSTEFSVGGTAAGAFGCAARSDVECDRVVALTERRQGFHVCVAGLGIHVVCRR